MTSLTSISASAWRWISRCSAGISGSRTNPCDHVTPSGQLGSSPGGSRPPAPHRVKGRRGRRKEDMAELLKARLLSGTGRRTSCVKRGLRRCPASNSELHLTRAPLCSSLFGAGQKSGGGGFVRSGGARQPWAFAALQVLYFEQQTREGKRPRRAPDNQ